MTKSVMILKALTWLEEMNMIILLIVDVYYCITSLKGSVGILFYKGCISQMTYCSIKIILLTTCYSVHALKNLRIYGKGSKIVDN